MRELLGLADEFYSMMPLRRAFIAEATRLGVRLAQIQDEIERLNL